MASNDPMQGTSHVGSSHRGDLDEVYHVPTTNSDSSEPAWMKSDLCLLKAYLEEEECMVVREYCCTLDETPEPDEEVDQRRLLESRISIIGVGPRLIHDCIFEIFSISIHWNEEENMGGMYYHLFGNVLVTDSVDRNDCCLEAMNRSLQHPFIVSNGGHLPLHGLVRCLWYDPFIEVFLFLKGQRFDSSGKCCENESQVLIKKKSMLHCNSLQREGWLYKPVEKTIAGADDQLFFKIHYSVLPMACVVAVEVRLVCREKFKFGKICINGRLSVHWLQFEHLEGKLCDYKIMLFDSESSRSVSLGECFSTGRRILAVPCGYTLVFDADIYTDKGVEFIGQRTIRVHNRGKFFVGTFGDGSLKMQITLFNYI